MVMSAVNLLSPILNGGIRNVNFVNGRVLTAEDMTAERKANLQRQRLLGTCVGDGVGHGLEVSLSSSSVVYGTQVVHVTAGVAVNRNGDALQLASDTDVTLAATLPTAPVNGGLFTPCQPPQTQLTNPGIYVLTILPASGYQEQVPVAQLNSAGVATSCSSRFATAGVQFRLAPVTLASTGTGLQSRLFALANQIQTQLNNNASAASVAPALSQFRNGLAHVCFGTEALAGYAANPFPSTAQTSPLDNYGTIDSLREAGLMTDCEVPLAIMYWTQSGIQFVDMWSVRRPVFPADASECWPVFSGRRRMAEGLAIFLQFQDQAANLPSTVGASQLGTVAANSFFFYLPSAGFIPLGSINPSAGFDYIQFFSGRTYRNPVFMEGARLDLLFHSSFLFPPIDLSNHEMLWIYHVRENAEAIDNGATPAPAPYMLFTNGRVAFQGEAQYDLNYFNYANYM
jgi:hypothetical protein